MFHFQIPAVTRTRPGQYQDPVTHPGLPHEWQGSTHLSYYLLHCSELGLGANLFDLMWYVAIFTSILISRLNVSAIIPDVKSIGWTIWDACGTYSLTWWPRFLWSYCRNVHSNTLLFLPKFSIWDKSTHSSYKRNHKRNLANYDHMTFISEIF